MRFNEGSFGIVTHSELPGSTQSNQPQQTALKKYKFADDSYGVSMDVVRELSILAHVTHANIVSLLEVHMDATNRIRGFHMERMQMSLRQLLHTEPTGVSKDRALLLISQAADGLQHMHANGFMHRDVKPENMLVNGSTDVLKICDFGTCRRIMPAGPERCYTIESGTLWYREPRVLLQHKSYTEYVDVWATLCTYVQLRTGSAPFRGDSEYGMLIHIFRILGLPSLPHCLRGFDASTFPRFRATRPPWSLEDREMRSVLHWFSSYEFEYVFTMSDLRRELHDMASPEPQPDAPVPTNPTEDDDALGVASSFPSDFHSHILSDTYQNLVCDEKLEPSSQDGESRRQLVVPMSMPTSLKCRIEDMGMSQRVFSASMALYERAVSSSKIMEVGSTEEWSRTLFACVSLISKLYDIVPIDVTSHIPLDDLVDAETSILSLVSFKLYDYTAPLCGRKRSSYSTPTTSAESVTDAVTDAASVDRRCKQRTTAPFISSSITRKVTEAIA